MTKTDEFNKSIVIDLFKRKLQSPDVNNNQSVLLFNLCTHYALGVNFSQYQDLITSLIDLLSTKERKTNLYKMDIVWRGTTMLEREKLGRLNHKWTLNSTLLRFHNNQVCPYASLKSISQNRVYNG